VQKQAHKRWIWLAMDATTHQMMAFHVGDRSRESAQAIWATILEVYQDLAMFHKDQYEIYSGVIPAACHKAITKKTRKTNHIKRFNNTLRQRLARLVRDIVSVAKQRDYHILHLPLQPGKSGSMTCVAQPCHDALHAAGIFPMPQFTARTAQKSRRA
jgi:IS1 family transposase